MQTFDHFRVLGHVSHSYKCLGGGCDGLNVRAFRAKGALETYKSLGSKGDLKIDEIQRTFFLNSPTLTAPPLCTIVYETLNTIVYETLKLSSTRGKNVKRKRGLKYCGPKRREAVVRDSYTV